MQAYDRQIGKRENGRSIGKFLSLSFRYKNEDSSIGDFYMNLCGLGSLTNFRRSLRVKRTREMQDIPEASRGFFSGGTPRPLKGYHAPPPPEGVRGAKAPTPDGSEVSFFQTMQSIRKWIEFSKISIFFLPNNLFFLRKNSKNWTYLTGIYEFFRKIIWNFSDCSEVSFCKTIQSIWKWIHFSKMSTFFSPKRSIF